VAAAGVGVGGSGDRRAYPNLSAAERRATPKGVSFVDTLWDARSKKADRTIAFADLCLWHKADIALSRFSRDFPLRCARYVGCRTELTYPRCV
jgi:hypothetical protein